jgi:hypothetical protein
LNWNKTQIGTNFEFIRNLNPNKFRILTNYNVNKF